MQSSCGTIASYCTCVQAADKNKDEILDREEFAAFVHPHDVPHMRDVYITETMEDMDGDKDGYITIDEYIRKLLCI